MTEPLLPERSATSAAAVKFRSTYIARNLGFDKGLLIRFEAKSPDKSAVGEGSIAISLVHRVLAE
jgi:hypothetical protein